jgi:hypothetical protein
VTADTSTGGIVSTPTSAARRPFHGIALRLD